MAYPFNIKNIHLKNLEASTTPEFDPTIGGIPLQAQMMVEAGKANTRPAKTPDGNTIQELVVSIAFAFRYVVAPLSQESSPPSDDGEEQLAGEIRATIVIVYALDAEAPPTEEQQHAWVERNSLLHAWPYWRELCQNTLPRLSLPTTAIPLVDVNNFRLDASAPITNDEQPVPSTSSSVDPADNADTAA